MTERPKILCIRGCQGGDATALAELATTHDVVEAESSLEALAQIAKSDYAGLYISANQLAEAIRLGALLQNERILDGMPDGVVMLDAETTILWANTKFKEWAAKETVVGESFYAALGSPEILGPDFCPFSTVLATRKVSSTNLKLDDQQYLQVYTAPVVGDNSGMHLVATIRDITRETLQQQKLSAIHQAGLELADLSTDEVFDMGVDERIELLKSNILHHTQDLLNFDVVEIRLLDQASGDLQPLLSVGIDEEAALRKLSANPQANGVTGFVAATGKSYLCEDTAEDPLYLTGFEGAKSSLTVPLIWHDKVIGTFNVESPEPRAFTESDLQFLEIFSRDIAVAINTLELLVAQSANTAMASVEAIHGAVALPVDEILNDTVNVLESYIGHEPEVVARLQNILRNARDIKQTIHKVGEKLAPAQAVLSVSQAIEQRPNLKERRILVVDDDERVRNDAHGLLERYGCIVETAHTGGEAVFMVRNCEPHGDYDAIIADIRLPDLSGYELLIKLQAHLTPAPLILMSGFGYDPGHSIVKARQAGLAANAILYKPFRLDQLLATVETLLDTVSETSS
ncbi:MAG: response regulator [bacterium]|nr:response regulator [bacterium]